MMENQNKKEMLAAYKERKVTGGVYAIKDTVNGKMLLLSAADLQGSKNRFEFAQKTGGCINLKLQENWEKFGASAFTYELLEELEKKETQTPKEFREDIHVLLEMWLEKMDPNLLY